MTDARDSTRIALADTRRMREMSELVLSILTSPAFLEQIAAVKAAPPDRRLDEAAKRLTPRALRAVGIDLPHDIRLSSRYFDDQAQTDVELADNAAGVNIVAALSEVRPGLLDELKQSNPDIFRRIVEPGSMPRPLGGCVCGGWLGGCCGGGWQER